MPKFNKETIEVELITKSRITLSEFQKVEKE